MKYSRISSGAGILCLVPVVSAVVLISCSAAALVWMVFFPEIPVRVWGPAAAAVSLLTGLPAAIGTARKTSALAAETDLLVSGCGSYRISSRAYPICMPLVEQLNRAGEVLAERSGRAEAYLDEAGSLTETLRTCRETSEELYNRFFYSAAAAVMYDSRGTISDVNEQACRLLNYKRSDLLASSFWELYPADELKTVKKAIRITGKQAEIAYDSYLIDSAGIAVPVEIKTTVIDTAAGTYQSLFSDITLRKNMQAALEQSEQKFRSFIEGASDLMFITDPQGILTYTNPVLLYTLGYCPDELDDTHLSVIMEVNTEVPFCHAYHELIGKDLLPRECSLLSKEGNKIHGEMSGGGYYADSGDFLGFRGIFRDTSYRKKLEESQRLVQLGQLSADVAHDIKNQLTVLYSISEMALMDDTGIEELRENMVTIQEELHRINDVVRRLLQFSRPGQQRRESANIHTVIDFVVKLLEKMFYQAEITIEKNYCSGLPAVLIDQSQMREVFMNILQNSVEASPQGGEISIATADENGIVKIEIRDSGEGIPEKYLKKIFDPFFTTKENGTGLGVSACYGIIRAHDGDLSYASRENSGTCVTIHLPHGPA